MLNPKHFDFDSALTPPSGLLPWLTHDQSLTEKLRCKAGEAHLHVLVQQKVTTGWWARYVLNVQEPQLIQREIFMQACETMCWYARTIIPETVFETNKSFFDRLKNESLGSLVFNEPEITRRQFFHYAISKDSMEFYWPEVDEEIRPSDILWVRGAEFVLQQIDSFYLFEILLPGLLRVVR